MPASPARSIATVHVHGQASSQTLAGNARAMADDAAELVRLARALRSDAGRMVASVRQATEALEQVDLGRLMGSARHFAVLAGGRASA